MTKQRILLGIVLLLLVSFPALATAQDAEGGDYYIVGTLPNGNTYAGGLEILQYANEAYMTLSWQVAEPFYGQGILNGSVLSAGFGTGCTLSSYAFDEAGNLSGFWASTSDGKLNTETATFVDQTGATLNYTVAGSNSDGSPYQGTMNVTPAADNTTAAITQQIGDSVFNGIGIVQGNIASVVLGAEGCGVASYEIQDNGDLIGIWTVTGATTVASENATPINISGAHNIAGTNPDGTTYTGTAQVTADNQVHTVDYNINGTFPGVGIMRGNVVAVGFGGETCSVASYFVYPDGTLVGLWSLVGTNVANSEVAMRSDTPVYAEGALIPDVAGAYTVIGANPDNSTYEGTLTITPQGDVFQFSWAYSNGAIEGVGVQIGNTLMVGYGGDTCAVNGYLVSPESMDGIWATYGNNTLGAESLTR